MASPHFKQPSQKKNEPMPQSSPGIIYQIKHRITSYQQFCTQKLIHLGQYHISSCPNTPVPLNPPSYGHLWATTIVLLFGLLIDSLIIEMFQWKNVQLSPEDYQNYVNNQDQAQMRINNSNITQLEWSQLYHQTQLQSLNNKKIKKYVLAYENNLKRLMGLINGDMPPQELLSFYQRYSNELRMHLSVLYDQLGLLHIRNISTTVEFSLSRLLNLEEQMIKALCQKQTQIDDLDKKRSNLEMGKASQVCTNCLEEMQKNRNKFLIKQIMAVEQSSNQLEEQEAQVLTEPERIQQRLREATRQQDHDYQVERFYYLNSVEQVLRNREKTLKCNSAPLQNLLSEYLTQILEMLQGSQLTFTPKNLKEYDRVNKSYQSIDDMKSQINTEDFYKKVSILIEKPYQNLVENIEKYINKSTQNKSVVKNNASTQTTYLAEFNQIKTLEKCIGDLSTELDSLKQSKSRNEVDIINNMQSLHRLEVKYMDVINKNKNLQSQSKRQEQLVSDLKDKLAFLEASHKSDQNSIIDINTNQKVYLLKQIKTLQAKVLHLQSLPSITKTSIEIQTDPIQDTPKKVEQQGQIMQKQIRSIMHRRSQNKFKKRVSLMVEEIKTVKQSQRHLSKFSSDKMDFIDEMSSGKTVQNTLLEVPPNQQRSEARQKSIKIYTINPLSPLNDKLIHRPSLSKKSSKPKESENEQASLTVRLSTPMESKSRIKKVPDVKFRQGHQKSQIIQKNKHKKQRSDLERLSVVTGKKIITHNQTNQLSSLSRMVSKEQFINRESSLQYLNNQDENFIVKINHPQAIQQSSKEFLNALIQNEQTIIKPGYKEELAKLVKFSIKNFDSLVEKNIIGMICDMKFDRPTKTVSKRQQKARDSLSIVNDEPNDPTVDVECSKIGKRCLQIFFNMDQAEKYENRTGIWGQIDTFIMVDNNFNNFCEKIQSYFDDLKDLKPMLYQQSLLFLEKPYYFCQEVEGKDYETKQITIFKQSLRSFNVEKNWIKKLFRKLLRLHKLIHKNCSHVQKFLQIIGFFKM